MWRKGRAGSPSPTLQKLKAEFPLALQWAPSDAQGEKEDGCSLRACPWHLHIKKRWGLHKQNAHRCWKLQRMSSGLQFWLKCWFANCLVTSYKEGNFLCSLPGGQSKPNSLVRELRNYKQKVTRLWKCQMEKEVRWNFLFILTNDIFIYLQRCNLESLGESKTKTTKENKLRSICSGSIWNGNAYVSRGMHVYTTAITRAWLETWSGWVRAESLSVPDINDSPGRQ